MKIKNMAIILTLLMILTNLAYASPGDEYIAPHILNYDSVIDFSEGLALVIKDNKCGYVDKNCNEVIPLIYDDITIDSFPRSSTPVNRNLFKNGLAVVKKDGKYGYIDKNGKEIIPITYDYLGDFSEGLVYFIKGEKYGYLDENGKEVFTSPYMYLDYYEKFSNGLAITFKDGKYGFIDKKGKLVIPAIYDEVKAFSEQLACAKKDGHWGYVDTSGKTVTPFIYDDALSFEDGVAQVSKDNKFGYINKNGEIAVPLDYDYVSPFSEDLAYVVKDKKGGFVDKSGKEVMPCNYDYAESFSEGLAVVCKNENRGYIDKSGKEVIPLKYDDVSSFSEGLASVCKNDKWGYIDKNGKEIVPCIYDGIGWLSEDFSEGFAVVRKGAYYGYIDKTGKELTPFIYSEASSFKEGLAIVKFNGKQGVLTTDISKWYPLQKKTDFVGHWAESDIYRLRVSGIASGDSGGNMKPNSPITRAEFIKLINRVFEFTETSNQSFADVPSNAWYANEFKIAAEAGYIKGDKKGNANPEKLITRAEASVILSRLQNFSESTLGLNFKDSSEIPGWAKSSIAELYEIKFIDGYPDNTFRPNKTVTRAESFAIMTRALDKGRTVNGEGIGWGF